MCLRLCVLRLFRFRLTLIFPKFLLNGAKSLLFMLSSFFVVVPVLMSTVCRVRGVSLGCVCEDVSVRLRALKVVHADRSVCDTPLLLSPPETPGEKTQVYCLFVAVVLCAGETGSVLSFFLEQD